MANRKGKRYKSEFIKKCLDFYLKCKSSKLTYKYFGLLPSTLRQWIMNSNNEEVISLFEKERKIRPTFDIKVKVCVDVIVNKLSFAYAESKYGYDRTNISKWVKLYKKDIDLLRPRSGSHNNHDSDINIFTANIKKLSPVQLSDYYKDVNKHLTGKTNIEIFQFILAKPDINIKRVFDSLDITRQAYYKWKPNSNAINNYDLEFDKHIIKLHEEFPELGVLGMVDQLKFDYNISASPAKVRRYMRFHKYKAQTSKKTVARKNKTEKLGEERNIVNRVFKSDKPNTLWFIDCTCVKIGRKLRWLVCILDAYNKEIIKLKVIKHQNAYNIRRELRDSIKVRKVDTSQLILHSDQGKEFNNKVIKVFTDKNKIIHSFSRRKCPEDNALIESIIGKYKKTYNLGKEKVQTISKLIELTNNWLYKYNYRKPLRALGNVPPALYA